MYPGDEIVLKNMDVTFAPSFLAAKRGEISVAEWDHKVFHVEAYQDETKSLKISKFDLYDNGLGFINSNYLANALESDDPEDEIDMDRLLFIGQTEAVTTACAHQLYVHPTLQAKREQQEEREV